MTSNMKIEESKGKLVITIDTTKDYGDSQSGKTVIVGSTQGAHKLESGLQLNLTVYRKK